MRHIFSFLLFTAFLTFTAFEPAHQPHVDVYQLNLEKSSLNWNAKKVTGEHYGTINFAKGTLNDNHGSYSGLFEIDMSTIVVNDLKGGSKEKLENHLRSNDFFDTANHPASKLSIASIRRVSTDAGLVYKVTGQLTIKDITHPVEFDSSMEASDGILWFKGSITIDRTKYDIKYRSGQFFPEIGDKMIYDDFTLTFEVALQR